MGFWAVVPAAGIGQRMQCDRPKQYLPLGDKTVIEQTLSRLASHPDIDGIAVAIAKDDSWWPTLSLSISCEVLVVEGGDQRALSVLNALQALVQHIDADPWVLVHDAARPCVRVGDIDELLQQLSQHSVGGVLGVLMNDTVKRTDSHATVKATVDRRNLWRAYTPQMFRLGQLTTAIEQALSAGVAVTDEASAIEHLGLTPMMVEGHSDNIKITAPHDLVMASWLLSQQVESA